MSKEKNIREDGVNLASSPGCPDEYQTTPPSALLAQMI